MIRSHARKIGTLLETSTVTTGGSDWGAYTTDHSTANPYAQIGLAADEIVANDGNPSRIAMHDKVFRTMAANTNVKGLGGQGPNGPQALELLRRSAAEYYLQDIRLMLTTF